MTPILRILVFYFCCFGMAKAQVQGVELDEPVGLPAFVLTEDDETSLSETDLLGAWTITMFGFNTCPDVCPYTLANLEAALAETAVRVSPSSLPRVVFVSVDPERDRGVVSDYATFFHPDFRVVTGEREEIDKLIEATDSYYRLMRPDSTGHYDVQHTSAVSVVDPDGMLRAKL